MVPITDVEPMSLEELDEFLMSDDAPDDCMMLSDLDGFLTAVAIGPELIMPSEWLPWVWGEEDPEFSSDRQMERVLGAIMGRYNEIIDILETKPDAFEPVVLVNEDSGVVIAGDWAEGFLDGMALRPRSWQALMNAEDGKYLAPIVVFRPGPDGHWVSTPGKEDHEREIRENAGDLIPECVAGIYRFFKKPRAFFDGKTKLGRNDPCFCGSGKKFKNCCGADAR